MFAEPFILPQQLLEAKKPKPSARKRAPAKAKRAVKKVTRARPR